MLIKGETPRTIIIKRNPAHINLLLNADTLAGIAQTRVTSINKKEFDASQLRIMF